MDFCESVPDCRNEKNRLYTASELVFITLVSVMCGSDTWDDVELFCRSQFDYFKKRLPNLRGLPHTIRLTDSSPFWTRHGLRAHSAHGLLICANRHLVWWP